MLGLHLEPAGEQLRLYDPVAVHLQTPTEVREALDRETAARLAAEAEIDKLRTEIQALRRSATPDS